MSGKLTSGTKGSMKTDAPKPPPVRLDYSDTYFENDVLDLELDDKLAGLHRARYRASVDREMSLKEEKKKAEDMRMLKDAVNRRSSEKEKLMNSASNKGRDVQRSGGSKATGSGKERREDTVDGKNKQPIITNGIMCEEIQKLSVNDESDLSSDSDEDDKQESVPVRNEVTKAKPLNTLTMFAISLQKLTNHRPFRQQVDVVDEPDRHTGPKTTNFRIRSAKDLREASRLSRQRLLTRGNPRRSKTAAFRRNNNEDIPVYGEIAERRTRSRRQLEEISQHEQSQRFDQPDKYESRRKTLLHSAKNDNELQGRINTFLTDIDDFKKRNRSNSLSAVDFRSQHSFIY